MSARIEIPFLPISFGESYSCPDQIRIAFNCGLECNQGRVNLLQTIANCAKIKQRLALVRFFTGTLEQLSRLCVVTCLELPFSLVKRLAVQD